MSSYNIQKWQHECVKNRESIGKKVKRVHCLCYSHQRPSWITFTPKTDGFFSHFSPPKSHCSNSAMAPHAVYLPGKNTNTTSPLPKQRVHIQLLCHIQLQSKGATTPRDQLPEAFHPVGHSSAPQRSVLSAPSAPCLPNARKQDRKQGGLLPKYYPWLTKHLMFIFSFFFFQGGGNEQDSGPSHWGRSQHEEDHGPHGQETDGRPGQSSTPPQRGMYSIQRRGCKKHCVASHKKSIGSTRDSFFTQYAIRTLRNSMARPGTGKTEYKQAKLFLSISLWRSENVVFYCF